MRRGQICYPNCWIAMRVIFDGLGGNDSKELILDDVQPTEATVHLNGYNQADTFEVAFNANVLPFSPEVIRAMSVEVFMFNAPKLLSPKEARDYLKDENRLIQGLMDDIELDYGMSGRSMRVSGRDQTAILADQPWPPGDTIETGRDLRETVEGMVRKAQNGRGQALDVKWSDDLPAPTVSGIGQGITSKSNKQQLQAQQKAQKAAAVKKPRTNTGRSKTTKERIPVLSGRSYWDAISELCLQYGHLVYVQGTTVVIRPPQSISEETADQIMHFAYGRNLAELRVKRHLGREAAPQIVASFYDAGQKQFIEVKWPKTDKEWIIANAGAQKATATSAGSSVNFRRILLPHGVRDEGQATEVCKAAYLTYGRSEAQTSFETKALKDLQDLDLLKLRPGNPVSIAFDSLDKKDLREQTTEQRRKTLLDLGYREQVASIVAQNYDRLDQLRRPLYTKEITFSYSRTDGIGASVEAINYIAPKRDEVTS